MYSFFSKYAALKDINVSLILDFATKNKNIDLLTELCKFSFIHKKSFSLSVDTITTMYAYMKEDIDTTAKQNTTMGSPQ